LLTISVHTAHQTAAAAAAAAVPMPDQVLSGSPVEINPSLGAGFKVMDVNEWAARWKTSAEFPQCLACGSSNTKEHAFTQVG
jgi:hypothetical protein